MIIGLELCTRSNVAKGELACIWFLKCKLRDNFRTLQIVIRLLLAFRNNKNFLLSNNFLLFYNSFIRRARLLYIIVNVKKNCISGFFTSITKTLFIAFIWMKYLILFLLFSSVNNVSFLWGLYIVLYDRYLIGNRKLLTNFYTQTTSIVHAHITSNRKQRYSQRYKRTIVSVNVHEILEPI